MIQKFNHESFIKELQNSSQDLSPFYIICGNEFFLIQETVDSLKSISRKKGYSGYKKFLIDQKNSNWVEIFSSIQSISLFDKRRIIELNIPTGKPGKYGSENLIRIAEKIKKGLGSDICIVLIISKIDNSIKNSQWLKELFKVGIVINIPTIDSVKLPIWIKNRLYQQGQFADSNLLNWIADKVEGNLLAAHHEILKLELLCPKGKLNNADAQEAIFDVSHHNVFDLRESILLGKVHRTIRILNQLREEDQPLPMIIWIIGEGILDLCSLINRKDKFSISSIKELKIFKKPSKYCCISIIKKIRSKYLVKSNSAFT
ncbi:MAG: DNA polymerase III subunit delta [Bordetella sp.]|nr:MAG: DNA polymerase III subunit delta [Bordetella sp.]